MRWRLRAALAISIVSMALSACGGDKKASDPAEWAAGICTAEQQFADAIAESRDNRDPSSLELNERKERAARLGEIEVEAAKQLAKDLDALTPPDEAKEYHQALITQANDVAKAIEAQVKAIEKATTAQQIAVANASAQFETRGASTEVRAKAATLSDALIETLVDQPACGRVPLPGQPEEAEPTPSA